MPGGPQKVMASYWESQRPILAALQNKVTRNWIKVDRPKMADKAGQKAKQNKEGKAKPCFQEIPTPKNEYSTPLLTTINKK